MRKRFLRGLNISTFFQLLIFINCASQDLFSQGVINESNYQQIAALTLAIGRLPEEAALAGYFTAHEDPMVHCITGEKIIGSSGSDRIEILYEDCGFENITWNGAIEQPDDQDRIPYTIVFGGIGGDFSFFQTDSTFFAPFIEQVGFAFKGDFSVDHVDRADIFSGTAIDIHFQNDFFDDLHSFRNMRVNRSYDSTQAHYGFEMVSEISSDLMPIVDCEVTIRFQRYEDHYPYRGKLSIVAVDDGSQVDLQVVPNGNKVLLKLDSDNDAVFEQEQSMTWEEIRLCLPRAYQALFSYYWHS